MERSGDLVVKERRASRTESHEPRQAGVIQHGAVHKHIMGGWGPGLQR